MHNSRILTKDFDFIQPTSLVELFDIIGEGGENTLLIAGGTDVIPQVKEGRKSPDKLVSTMKVPELDFVKVEDGILKIGAATKLKNVAAFCKDIQGATALYEGISAIGKLQILNMGTIAGNICTASPAADSVPALLAMGASVVLKSSESEREVYLQNFLLSPGKVAMEAGEIVYSINVPMPEVGVASEFKKLERVGADIAKINMAIVVKRTGDICEKCEIAVGSCGPTTLVMKDAKALLEGKDLGNLEESFLREVGNSISAEITPIDDIRSTAEYRRKVASVIFMDAFIVAWNKAGGAVS